MKRISVRVQLLLLLIFPVILIGATLLFMSSSSLSNGMLSEALDGLLSSAKLYRQEILTTGRDLSTNELEDEYNSITGYEYTRFEGDTRVVTSLRNLDGSRLVGTKASQEIIDEVLIKGHEYVNKNTKINGEKYCVAYIPISDESGKIVGIAFSGKPTAEIEDNINRSVISTLIAGLVIIILSVGVVIFVSNNLIKAIETAHDVINNLSDGEFNKADRFLDRNDELGDMIRESNSLIDKLSMIVESIKESARTVGSNSKELAETSEQISDTADSVTSAVQDMALGANDQADSIQKTTENTGVLSDAMVSVLDNTESLSSTAIQMNEASNRSAESLKKLQSNMSDMDKAVETISDAMKETNDAVNKVNEKVDGITGIASQTNLLALNASIEAARAGEAGRGFSVVAEEIGKLATDSARTASEIRDEMTQLLMYSQNATEKTSEVSNIGKEVSEVLIETVEVINGLINNVNNTVNGVNKISDLIKNCNSSKDEIVDAMSSLSAISEENAASNEETSASMEQLNATVNVLAESADKLNGISKKLEEELSFFKI